MSHVETEIFSQPKCWRWAAEAAAAAPLPAPGERVAAVGCGTSWFMAQSYAALREAAGQGETDAFPASEMPTGRRYDRVLVLTRSGSTTEVLTLLAQLPPGTPTIAVTADRTNAVVKQVSSAVVLDFADEKSVVQTRFATSALVLLRSHLGENLTKALDDLDKALREPLPEGVTNAEQFSFLGQGWAVGLALEAALKMREAAGVWTEAYPAMEYRHGPISITGPGRIAWMLGNAPAGLAQDVALTGGRFVTSPLDPLAELVRVQRLAMAVATSRGMDPDRPRHLSRSVILP